MPACAGDLPLPIYHSCALHLNYTACHVYCKHHRSRLNCFALTGILFSPALPFVFSFRLLLWHSNHSAFNSHNFPRTYTTTYLLVNDLSRRYCRFGNYLVSSGCTYGLNTVSFHSICSEVSFDAVSRCSLLMRFTR